MKRFICHKANGEAVFNLVTAEEAAVFGWEITPVGVQIIERMSVGETTIDDDGDTWERVE